MTKRKSPETKAVKDAQLKAILLKQADVLYREHLSNEMGKLHNRFVAFISESRLPLPQIMLVLDMLKNEAVDLARKAYLDKKVEKPKGKS